MSTHFETVDPNGPEALIMKVVQTALSGLLDAHDRHCGDQDCLYRANVLANLAYLMDMKQKDMPAVLRFMRLYELRDKEKKNGTRKTHPGDPSAN